MSRHIYLAKLGDWTFYQVDDPDQEALFGFTVGTDVDVYGKPRTGELYNSLEHAMAAAIAEKYTGKRGAGGTGVDTAAGWFMRMIGADQLHAEPDPAPVVSEALRRAKGLTRPPVALTSGFLHELEKAGRVVARRD